MQFFQTSFFLLLFLCSIASIGLGNFRRGSEERRKNGHYHPIKIVQPNKMNYQILNNNNNNNNNDNNNNDNNNNENNNENNNNENNNNDKNVNENGQKENENNQNSNVEQKNGQKKKNWWKRKIDWFGSSEIKKKKNNHSNFTNNNNNDDKNNKNNNDKKNEIKKYDKNDFGAVCVMGELRQFEKTVSGIFQYFVRYLAHHFKRIDVFFSSFINPESYKIFLAIKEWELLKRNLPPNSEVRLLAIRMPFQYPNQYSPYRNVTLPYSLTGDDGIFGLFNLTLGCNQMILEQEEKEGFKYDRIFKTRVDSLWYDFPKNLSFSQNCVFLPKKYNYGGHNDRFLMGLRDDMIIANDRFEALHKYPPLKRFANSEFSLKMEFRRTHLCVRLILDIPFCVYRSLSKHADGLITEFPSRIHPINNGGTCRECQRGNCTNFTASERQALFIQQAGVGAAKPIFLLEEIIGKISSIDDCEKILSLEIRDFWNSDSTIKDVCIFGKDEIEAQQKRQEKLEPEFERNLFFISEQVSSTAKRALMVWDNESTCLRFPITCTEKEKLQIEIRNRERDLALLANKSKPNKTIESVQRDWSGVPALLFSRHRRISRKKPRKIDEEKEVGNGGILGFFKTIFGVF